MGISCEVFLVPTDRRRTFDLGGVQRFLEEQQALGRAGESFEGTLRPSEPPEPPVRLINFDFDVIDLLETEWALEEPLSAVFELHEDFVSQGSGTFASLLPICTCGTSLEKGESDFGILLHASCPSCGKPLDPLDHKVEGQDPITGQPIRIRGGLVYRSCLRLDLGKNQVRSVEAAFLAEASRALGVELTPITIYT
jgi:hypothetical protein